MTKIIWDSTGSRFYETGLDRGILYDKNNNVIPWNGLTSITEKESNVTETISFIDGYRYLNKISTNNYSSVLSAYTYPKEFEEYIGTSEYGELYKKPKYFNLSYRTKIGNDISGIDHGYKIHIIYNAIAVQTSNAYISYGSQITPVQFFWNIETLPIELPNLIPSSHIIIDSTKVNAQSLSKIEELLYGTEFEDPKFLTISEIISIFDENSLFRIIDHGDGSFSAIGSDEYVSLIDPNTIQLNSSTVLITDTNTYRATSF